MKTEPLRVKAFTEKNKKINKWKYIIQRENSYTSEMIFQSDYIYNNEAKANQKIDEYFNSDWLKKL